MVTGFCGNPQWWNEPELRKYPAEENTHFPLWWIEGRIDSAKGHRNHVFSGGRPTKYEHVTNPTKYEHVTNNSAGSLSELFSDSGRSQQIAQYIEVQS